MSPEQRITDYLLSGGLFNPELMDHNEVKSLLLACRSEITALRARLAEVEGALREAIEYAEQDIESMWPAGKAMLARWEAAHGGPDRHPDSDRQHDGRSNTGTIADTARIEQLEREVARLTPYVDAFRREEKRADDLAQRLDEVSELAILDPQNGEKA